MKRLILFALGATCCMGTQAQVVDDDFDSFIKTEVQSFDKFIDDANKQFISFLRNPWKEFEAKKPVEKRTKPEPVKPVVYDEKRTRWRHPWNLISRTSSDSLPARASSDRRARLMTARRLALKSRSLSLRLRQLSLQVLLPSLRLLQPSQQPRQLRQLRQQWYRCRPLSLLHL